MSEPSSVDQTTPPAQASASEDPSVAAIAAPPEDKLTLGQQIAGGLLLVNAIFVLLSEFLIPADPKLGPLFAPGRSVMPAIIDLAIGVSLLRGKPKYRTWALVRVLLGTVLFTAAAWGKDPLMTASQIMIGASLLLFLLGDAGRVRLVAGGAPLGSQLGHIRRTAQRRYRPHILKLTDRKRIARLRSLWWLHQSSRHRLSRHRARRDGSAVVARTSGLRNLGERPALSPLLDDVGIEPIRDAFVDAGVWPCPHPVVQQLCQRLWRRILPLSRLHCHVPPQLRYRRCRLLLLFLPLYLWCL